MNVDDLTIGQARQLAAMFADATAAATVAAAPHPAIGRWCVVRTYAAGVHAGILVSADAKSVELAKSRRIWSWTGALSCSEIAVKGISGGNVAVEVPTHFLMDAIEIIPGTDEAQECLRKL